MSDAATHHRLEGLEPDNLLAFLALLGLLRSLEAADREQPENMKLRPRAFWDTQTSPFRPAMRLSRSARQMEVAEVADQGISILKLAHDFGDRKDLNYNRSEAQNSLKEAAVSAVLSDHYRADLLASLMTDAALKENKNRDIAAVDPTPLCLLFGQGHQHFLERMAAVPAQPAPPPTGKGKAAKSLSAAECLYDALFQPWQRSDPTFSFRWDPEEDVRYALMAGDPTDNAYKGGAQHGANRLASVGLAVLAVAPVTRLGRVRPAVTGGSFVSDGFSFRWPIWRDPATLATIKGLLNHPRLSESGALAHLGVEFVMTTRRISVGKFMNFTRARVQT